MLVRILIATKMQLLLSNNSITLNPDGAARTYSNLGYPYICLERYEEAITACKQAIRLNLNYAAAYYKLGYYIYKIMTGICFKNI